MEDKKLYQRQVKSGVKIGYSMVKQAPFESVHPRKRIQLSKTQPLVSSSQLQHTQTHKTVSESSDSETSYSLPCHQPLLPDHPLLNTNQNTKEQALQQQLY